MRPWERPRSNYEKRILPDALSESDTSEVGQFLLVAETTAGARRMNLELKPLDCFGNVL